MAARRDSVFRQFLAPPRKCDRLLTRDCRLAGGKAGAEMRRNPSLRPPEATPSTARKLPPRSRGGLGWGFVTCQENTSPPLREMVDSVAAQVRASSGGEARQ